MNHYLVTALPPLPPLGGVPAWGPAQLLEHVDGSPRAREALGLIFLQGDLRRREAHLAGEPGHDAPVVLTAAQVRGEAPLPPAIAVEIDGLSPRDAADAVWAAYFRRVAARAEALRSPLLAAWVQREVALKAALARARAALFGLEPTAPAAELGLDASGVAAVVAAWGRAPDALAALEVLDLAQLAWIGQAEPWFSFSDEELLAYGLRLEVIRRWQRLARAGESAPRPRGPQAEQGARR